VYSARPPRTADLAQCASPATTMPGRPTIDHGAAPAGFLPRNPADSSERGRRDTPGGGRSLRAGKHARNVSPRRPKGSGKREASRALKWDLNRLPPEQTLLGLWGLRGRLWLAPKAIACDAW
jgi:hypothetical protein